MNKTSVVVFVRLTMKQAMDFEQCCLSAGRTTDSVLREFIETTIACEPKRDTRQMELIDDAKND